MTVASSQGKKTENGEPQKSELATDGQGLPRPPSRSKKRKLLNSDEELGVKTLSFSSSPLLASSSFGVEWSSAFSAVEYFRSDSAADGEVELGLVEDVLWYRARSRGDRRVPPRQIKRPSGNSGGSGDSGDTELLGKECESESVGWGFSLTCSVEYLRCLKIGRRWSGRKLRDPASSSTGDVEPRVLSRLFHRRQPWLSR